MVFAPLEYFREALGRLHEVLAVMLLRGVAIVDDESLLPVLKASAATAMRIRAEHAAQPNPFEQLVRHRPLSLLPDAEDLLDVGDTDGAIFVTSSAIGYSLQTFVARKDGRDDVKQSYRKVAAEEPRIHELLRVFQGQHDGPARIAAAYEVVNALYGGPRGGVSAFGTTGRLPWQQALAFFGG